MWWSKDGNAHKIGEPSGEVPRDILDRCFSRMAAWVKLSISVIKQEYPDYELVSCFGVLSLDIDTSAGCFSLSDDQEKVNDERPKSKLKLTKIEQAVDDVESLEESDYWSR